MTENADVKWLRETFGGYIPPEFNAFATREVYFMQMRRLLAHIDQLEAEAAACRSNCEDLSVMVNAQQDRRPTVHEIAVQIFAGWVRITGRPSDELLAASAYKASEALVAEGQKR